MLLLRAVIIMNTVAGQFQIQQGKEGALINDYTLNKKIGLMIVAVQSRTATRGQVLRMTAKGWAKKTIFVPAGCREWSAIWRSNLSQLNKTVDF